MLNFKNNQLNFIDFLNFKSMPNKYLVPITKRITCLFLYKLSSYYTFHL